MTTPLVTVPQVLKLAGMFTEVPRDRMNGIGFGLAAIMAEYLSQPNPRRLSLKTVRQVLGLPPMAEEALAVVHWREVQPTQHFEAATIRQPAKPRYTILTRLRPTDVGLPNDAHPNDVIELASSWGYQSVPRGALDEILRNPPRSGHYHGFAMVPLGNGQYTYLFIGGGIREVSQMVPDSTDYDTTWSVVMAC